MSDNKMTAEQALLDVLYTSIPSGEKLDRAVQAVKALSAPRVPAGWKLVPVEPTKTMLYSAESPIDEIISCRQSSQHAIAKAAYTAMLAASPEPVAEQTVCSPHDRPCTYPDCKCPFDMGAANKCLRKGDPS